MSNSTAIRIAIADDHPVVRQGLAAMIARQPGLAVVGEAASGLAALELFHAQRPDVLLLDLRMPDLDGVEVIVQIRTAAPDARILVLTTFDSDEDVYRALRAGAMGYLLKGVEPEVLIEAIRAVHAGHKRIPHEIAAKLSERMTSQQLTLRELEVLKLLVTGLSNKEIGTRLSIGEGTVRAHVNNLFSKLNVQDRTQAATLAIKRGIVRLE